MNSNKHQKKKRGLSASGLATVLLSASLAVAKSYDIAVDTMSLAANVVDKTMPAQPKDEEVRNRQDGRVHVGLAVTPVVPAVDPVVVNPVGGAPCGSRNLYGSTMLDNVEQQFAAQDGQQLLNRETSHRALIAGEKSALTGDTQRKLLVSIDGLDTA